MLAAFTAIAAIMVGFVTIGILVDNSLPHTAKAQVATALQQAAGKPTNLHILKLFLAAFDSVFDRGHRRRPEFLRAGFVSCLILGVMTLRWRLVHADRAEPVLDLIFDMNIAIAMGVTLTVLVVCFNWIGDYFSLWETRIVMEKLAVAENWMSQVSWIGLDIVATIVIYWVGATCAMVSLGFLLPEYYGPPDLLAIWGTLLSVFVDGGITLNHENSSVDPFAIFFHTSLFTSVWAWALVAGFVLWSLFKPLLTQVGQLGALFTRFPVACLMLVGSFFAGCVFAAIDGALEWIS